MARNSHTTVASDWTYHSFTCENHRSLLWLARTSLRTKIYDIAFWWEFLSMYIISKYMFFSGHVTRSSPVLYHEYCIQDGNLLPRLFSLLLLTLLLPVFTTHALLPIFLEEPWVLEWIRIRVDGKIRFQNGFVWTWEFLNPEINSCSFMNTRIRMEGAWMNDWMVCHPVSRC